MMKRHSFTLIEIVFAVAVVAVSLAAVMPVIVVFFFAQRQFFRYLENQLFV